MILSRLLTLLFISLNLTSALVLPLNRTNHHALSLPSPSDLLPLNLSHHYAFTLPSLSNALTFRLTIARAVRYVQSLHPPARLTRIQGTSPLGPIDNPTAMTDINLYFAIDAPHVSIRLDSWPHATRWGQWLSPEVVPEERPESELGLGDVLTSDIVHVLELIRNAGYGAKFEALDVVREEGMTEVRWMFQMEGLKGWVWVGDESGEVDEEEGAERYG